MKELNDEQKLIIEEILHKKLNIKKKPLHIFLTRGVHIGKTFTLMYIIQNMLKILHKKYPIYATSPIKPKA